jgi:RNA polymerase sigma factor for flagellar operon FliA
MSSTLRSENELVIEYTPMVRRIVGRLRAQLKLRVEPEDLEQLGMLGLIEAARRYDPLSGVPFTAYAHYRIRGSVLDSLKRMTGVGRAQARSIVKMRAAAEFSESLAESGAGQESAASDAEYVDRAIEGVMFVGDLSDLAVSGRDDDDGDDNPHSARIDSPETLLRRRQTHELVHAALDAMPEDEGWLVREHYINGRSLAELGEERGISRSWACRLHARAVERLKRLLQQRHGQGFF